MAIELELEQPVLLSLLDAIRGCLTPLLARTSSLEMPQTDHLPEMAHPSTRRGLFHDAHPADALLPATHPSPPSLTSHTSDTLPEALSDHNLSFLVESAECAGGERRSSMLLSLLLLWEPVVLQAVLRLLHSPSLTASVMRACLSVCAQLRLSSSLLRVMEELVSCLQRHGLSASGEGEGVGVQLRLLLGNVHGEVLEEEGKGGVGATRTDDEGEESEEEFVEKVLDEEGEESDWDDWDEEEDLSAEAG
ncbi:MAG: hypothetical protein SGPRY_003290 [Prymnesium sp.]